MSRSSSRATTSDLSVSSCQFEPFGGFKQIVKPACKPRTYQGYEVVVRVHLVPALGKKKLNKLTGADVRLFLRRLENMCLCCIHKTDQKRAEGERRCCAVGRCCKSLPSVRLRQQAHAVLRNALEAAVREERAHVGSDWVETGDVFTSVIGTPIEPDNLRRSWYPLREKIGAEGVRFHDLRHTCVTLLQMRNVASDATFGRIRDCAVAGLLTPADLSASRCDGWADLGRRVDCCIE
ncbi:hypothetical protein [Frankia sp. Cas4]|uniref:hypothetical protein n=1 Tax=Frankia sp. Cas4 TaxID=3073927 RepID=UPI002AD59037|nr:hypothetical protein [Frankia sp. Cas4]